jgi:hypothetical protein
MLRLVASYGYESGKSTAMFESVTELEDVKARPGEIVARYLRYLVLVVVSLVLCGEWYDKSHPPLKAPIPLGDVGLIALGVVFLFFLLIFVEAIEIAYTLVTDKHDDQFPDKAKALIQQMQQNEPLVYGAREWVVTMLLIAITLVIEYREPVIPVFKLPVHKEYEFLWLLFTVLLTAAPIIWLAQAPGKILARADPLRTLMLRPTRGCWKLVCAMGWALEKSGLGIPEDYVKKRLERAFPKKNQIQLRPSDAGFFLAGLQRYGLALHELSVKITVKEDGSCVVEQKLVWYLLRFTGTYFTRRFYFESDVARNGPPQAQGFTCPLVTDSYETVAQLLDGIWRSPAPEGLKEAEPWAWDWDPPAEGIAPKAEPGSKEVRFWVHTHYKFPENCEQAFALRVSYEGVWEKNAFKTGYHQSDSYETTFEYPCRTYILEIVPEDGVDIRLANPEASVTFNHNPHDDERQRLEKALNDDPDHAASVRGKGGIYCKLHYPIAGAQYKYSWTVARRHGIHKDANNHATTPAGT